MLPEWNYFYASAYKPGDTPPTINASGALMVLVKNTGASSVTVDDFTINGQGLKNGIKCDLNKLYKCDINACSCFTKQTLIDAGAPVWWRVDPNPIPAGGTAEVYVRMRNRIATTLSCNIVPTSGSSVPTSITVSGNAIPRVASYAMSSDMTNVFLYLRHPTAGTQPTQILVDNVDKTSSSTICADADLDLAVVKIATGSALARGSFHTFQAVYSGGAKASTGLRVFYDNFKCATWGCPPLANDTERHNELVDRGNHGVNMFTVGTGDLSDYLKTTAGKALMDQYGMKYTTYSVDDPRTYAYFLCDEPDIGDYNVGTNIAPTVNDRIGCLAQGLWAKAQQKKINYASVPCMLNVDETFKPYNYYHYGHLPEILSTDPYYTQVLCDVFWKRPWQIPVFTKAIYKYAHVATANAACEPRPLHVIMNSCRYQDGTKVFRFGTPEEKRLEAYYSLAGGAKQFGYWWLSPIGVNTSGFCGLGKRTEPGSSALWREIGLINNEALLASQVLVNSAPTVMPITTNPGSLWVRALVSGTDTLVLIGVNDDHANDQSGTLIRPIPNVEVSFDLPSWLTSPTHVFEVSYRGITNVSNSINSGTMTISTGRVDVSKMIIITKNSSLKSSLETLYTNTYLPRLQSFMPLP
jgi:hypothetical protein